MKKTILIVDDDRNVCKATARALSGKYMTHIALSGKQALEIIQKENNIDLVLTDVMMPAMNGIELLGNIRKISKNTAVIIVSSFYTIDLALEAVNLGAHAYLTKPVDVDNLELSIQSALNS